MNKPFYENLIKGDEQSERRYTTNNPIKIFTNLVLHIKAFEPSLNLPRCLICSALSHRTVFSKLYPMRLGRPSIVSSNASERTIRLWTFDDPPWSERYT